MILPFARVPCRFCDLGVIEDLSMFWVQLSCSKFIICSTITIDIAYIIQSICAVAVTKYIAALERSILDNLTVVIVWIASTMIGWEQFNYMEMYGFIVVLIGGVMFSLNYGTTKTNYTVISE